MRSWSLFLVGALSVAGGVRSAQACSLVLTTQSITFSEVAQGPNLPVSFTLYAQGLVPAPASACTTANAALQKIAWGVSVFGSLFDLVVKDRVPPGGTYDPALHFLLQPDVITQLGPQSYQRHRTYSARNDVAPGFRTEIDLDLYSTGSYCAVYPCLMKAGTLTPTTATLTYTVILDDQVFAQVVHNLNSAERATLALAYLR